MTTIQDNAIFSQANCKRASFIGSIGNENANSGHALTTTVQPKQMVFYEGDPAEYVYEVMSGTVKLYKLLSDGRRQITGFFFPGDLIGVGLYDNHSHSAEAITEVTLRKISRTRLHEAISKNPVIGRHLFGLAADELASAQEQLLLLGRKSPVEKVATFLLKLSERNGERGEAATPIYLPMARSDIADYLGLTTETVSRTFSRLRRERAIRLLENHLVDLLDLDRLESYADGEDYEHDGACIRSAA